MIYIDQNSTELRLSLTGSEFNREPLNVICSNHININGIDVEYGILGASHFVTIPSLNFTEIFACVNIDNTESVKLDKGIKLQKHTKEYSYEFIGVISPWKKSGKYDYELSNRKVKTFKGLQFDFPSEKEGKFQARTNVVVFEKNKQIIIETIHAYPNEDNVVCTLSKIDIN